MIYMSIFPISLVLSQKVTNVLSQANLSIINLSIQETREDIFGVLELSFKNQADLLKGQKLIEAEKFHCWIRS